jgi:hypothetical protein
MKMKEKYKFRRFDCLNPENLVVVLNGRTPEARIASTDFDSRSTAKVDGFDVRRSSLRPLCKAGCIRVVTSQKASITGLNLFD